MKRDKLQKSKKGPVHNQQWLLSQYDSPEAMHFTFQESPFYNQNACRSALPPQDNARTQAAPLHPARDLCFFAQISATRRVFFAFAPPSFPLPRDEKIAFSCTAPPACQLCVLFHKLLTQFFRKLRTILSSFQDVSNSQPLFPPQAVLLGRCQGALARAIGTATSAGPDRLRTSAAPLPCPAFACYGCRNNPSPLLLIGPGAAPGRHL